MIIAALGTLLTGLAAILKKNCGEAEPNPNGVSGNSEQTAEMEDQPALSWLVCNWSSLRLQP